MVTGGSVGTKGVDIIASIRINRLLLFQIPAESPDRRKAYTRQGGAAIRNRKTLAEESRNNIAKTFEEADMVFIMPEWAAGQARAARSSPK